MKSPVAPLGPVEIANPVQLLIEGNDGRNWFRALAKHQSLETVVQVHNYGVHELRRFLKAFANMPAFSQVARIGIVRDAEESATGAFASVQGALRRAGLPIPPRVGAIEGGRPAVSVLVLPDGSNPGMLESALRETIGDRRIRACIDGFLQCAEKAEKFEIRRREKAFIHAFLATRPQPHVSVGVAAQKGYWDFEHPALQGVRSFLSALARPEAEPTAEIGRPM